MNSHELARHLLARPDLPVAIHANNHNYSSKHDARTHGSLHIALALCGNEEHVLIGNQYQRDMGNQKIIRDWVGQTTHDASRQGQMAFEGIGVRCNEHTIPEAERPAYYAKALDILAAQYRCVFDAYIKADLTSRAMFRRWLYVRLIQDNGKTIDPHDAGEYLDRCLAELTVGQPLCPT